MKWSEFFRRFFVVCSCVGCQERLAYEEHESAFCPKCVLAFRAARLESCPDCFRSAHECICMPKGLSKTGALCLRKLTFYHASKSEQPQNKMIYHLKRKPNARVARFLSRDLSGAVREELGNLGIEDPHSSCVFVGVPRSRASFRRYGFDQSELIGRALGEEMNIPYVRAIKRHWGGAEQKKLGEQARFRNIRHLFSMVDSEAVCGKRVLLIDDVVTTGASMAACVTLLKKAGAREILCVCLSQNYKR